jgi:O-acetyl-ADP-ribose deacetylase (regulator of RNase III)
LNGQVTFCSSFLAGEDHWHRTPWPHNPFSKGEVDMKCHACGSEKIQEKTDEKLLLHVDGNEHSDTWAIFRDTILCEVCGYEKNVRKGKVHTIMTKSLDGNVADIKIIKTEKVTYNIAEEKVFGKTTVQLVSGHPKEINDMKADGFVKLEDQHTDLFLKVGSPKVTGGSLLNAKRTIHTLRLPRSAAADEKLEQFALTYRSCLKAADQHKIHTLVFPPMCTNESYDFRVSAATEAWREVKRHCEQPTGLQEIDFYEFDEKACELFKRGLAEMEDVNPADSYGS